MVIDDTDMKFMADFFLLFAEADFKNEKRKTKINDVQSSKFKLENGNQQEQSSFIGAKK